MLVWSEGYIVLIVYNMPGSHQKFLSNVGVEKATGEPHNPGNEFSSPEMCNTFSGSTAFLLLDSQLE